MAEPQISLQSEEMDRLFLAGATSYQPEGLSEETGDPKVAFSNLNRLLAQGCIIKEIQCRPTGVLIVFKCGKHYYTSAFRVGGDGLETEYLAEIAAKAGFGPLEQLLDAYHEIPATCRSILQQGDGRPGSGITILDQIQDTSGDSVGGV